MEEEAITQLIQESGKNRNEGDDEEGNNGGDDKLPVIFAKEGSKAVQMLSYTSGVYAHHIFIL